MAQLPKPGPLRSTTTLSVQTLQAQLLVFGRRAEGDKPAIVGLIRFGAMLGPIWQGAVQDDPWADWWLIRVEDKLGAAREHVKALLEQTRQTLAGVPSIDVEVAQSIEPAKVEVAFKNPYAYHGAFLLADFDELARAVLTARHVGLMNRESSERTLRDGGRAVRRAYQAAHGYKYLAVTREDLEQGTAKTNKALELMGEIPREVVAREWRSNLAPAIQPREGQIVASADDGDTDGTDDDEPASADPVRLMSG